MTSPAELPDPSSAAPRLVVRSPADLLAAVPYLLGFHPRESLVVVALGGPRLVFVARADLPVAGAPGTEIEAVARYVGRVVAQQGADAAAVIGYGSTERVDAIMPGIRAAVSGHGLEVVEVLRVHDGRFWSCLCTDPECCPPEGSVFDPACSPVAAAATYAGQLALPDRSALANRVAPVRGAARRAMTEADARARGRLADLRGSTAPATAVPGKRQAHEPRARAVGGAGTGDGRSIGDAGEEAVAELLAVGAAGDRPSDDQVAWLSLLLSDTQVRDLAWRQVGPADWQLDLWSDVVRRAQPGLVAAPASLLAFAAWVAGNGALANVALDRAVADRPDYPMASLLRAALDQGLPPSVLEREPEAARLEAARLEAARAGRPERASGRARSQRRRPAAR